ncbi:MAG: ABC transporter ATP-binding protein [Rickettsiaceae bacterium]|nr:ABC transporter ATP-binding protein [Rickettsiaceae bacterium]
MSLDLDSQESSYNDFHIIKRLFSNHIKPYLGKIFLSLFFMVVVAACGAAIVSFTKPMIDEVFVNKNYDKLIRIIIFILSLFFVKGVAEYFQSYIVKCIGQRILTDIQMLMYEHLLKSDLQLIQMQSSGRLISRFTNDISMMRGAVSNLLVGIAKHFLSVTFLIILMFKEEPFLSLCVFVVFPLAIYPIHLLGRKMKKISYKTQEALGHYTAVLDEIFSAIKIVKSYLGEDIEVKRATGMTENIFNLYKKSAKFDALTSPVMEILNGIAVGGILWYGGTLVINGTTTAGALFTFITAFISAYRPYKSLVALNVNLQEGLAAARRLFQVLDTRPEVRDNDKSLDVKFKKPDIVFNDVSLIFEGKRALEHLNLKIDAGSTVAFIGQSGGGKTSIANLLVRFYEITSGSITINGHDISNISISSLRNQIALITQDTMLFDTTIAENISYGKKDATMGEIIQAAKNAAAHEFIMALPEGYNTIAGSDGLTLSGGQRQRIAIARAFLKDAPILVMDEATSALDVMSENSIQNALQLLRKGRTTIIITHRLSSIKDSDMIFVIKQGMVIESGSHEELLSTKGEYYNLSLHDKKKIRN